MKNIEYDSDIVQKYPLVPMQHGMLFNSLYQPKHGLDLTHLVYDLPEKIDFQALQNAWQMCVNQHETFRSSFQWAGVKEPVQHVHKTAVLPFIYEDWSMWETAVHAPKLTTFLRKDRKQGFDFHTPPLMRCALFKINDNLYRFIWTFHHSIIDGRASSLVLYEAFTRYETLMNGEKFPVEKAVPFQKYVNWLYDQDWSVAKSFWRERLAGFTQTTPIPPDSEGEPDVQVGDPACEKKLYLSAETTAKLHAITKQYSITFNTMIQGAWGLLLHHITNSDDIVFGTVRACRRSAFAGTENIIGQLINSVPIRAHITPNTPAATWLEALREQWNGIRPFEHIPYIQIKAWSDLPKGTPLFETTALYDHATVETRLKSLGGKWTNRTTEIFFKTDSPISLYAHGGEHMLLSIYYDRAKYQDDTVVRMLNQLEQIFTAFAADIQQPIDQISILSPSEQHTILHDWNNTQADIRNEACLHTLITQQAQSHPHTVAVDDGNTQLTYAQLDQQANQLAHLIIQQGITPGTPIGICYGRSHHLIVATLAILKAGGVYVPLDPTFPAKRLNFIQVDAQLPLILTHQQMDGLTCSQLICWPNSTPPIFQQMPTTPPQIESEINQPAYMIYTSGSTGQPKGVLCHHRSVVNLLDDFYKRSPLARDAHHSLWTNITFDVSVYEIFSALTTGGTLHIVPDEIRANTTAVLHWLQTHNIQSTYLPPFMLADMANWVEQHPQSLTIKRLLVGVEPILETTLARIQAQLPQAKILNGYGPTEATVCVSLHEFTAQNPKAKPTPIGRPMQNTQIYLLNRQMEPVPPGIAGELYIGGAGLAHGYWRRPELTENSFIPNPFIPETHLYKTGDMARYRPDGTIEFLGRRDFQVKVRGYRVELGEIEAILRQHDSVAQLVVVTRKDSVGNNYLVAYVVNNENEPFDETGLRDFLLAKLPDYMVPSTFVSLDALPLTANDKVDRKALPDSHSQFEEAEYVAPQSPIEELIANTFTAVLNVPMVSRNASFLQLGGHSLLATQLISRLNHALDIELPLRLIFTHPKVADLATAVTRQLTTENTTTSFIFTKADREKPLPLSFAQQRLWFLQQLEPENTAYNIPLALKLEGELETAVLEQSLNDLLRRHDSLRTIFPDAAEPPQQTIFPHTHFTLPIADVSAREDVETSVQTHIRTEAQTPFNLAESALRIRLLRLSPTHHVLLFTTHHIISDGWSHALFTRELAALYDAHAHHRPAALPPLQYQYADYAAAQRQWLQGDVLDGLTEYWREKLEATPEQLDLPTDFTRPTLQTHSANHFRIQLGAEQSNALRKLCQDEEATLFMGLLAAFKTLLHRLSQQDDIVVGAPIANRNHLQTEQLIGFFINTLVLRTQLHPDMPFTEFLQAVRDTTLTAYAHQDMPFEKLVELLQPNRDLGQTPFFHVFFNMVNVPEPETQLANVTMTQMPWGDVSAKFDLTLYVSESHDHITFELVYNSDLFSETRMETFLAQYVSLLTQISQKPTAPLASYTLAPAKATRLPDPTTSLTPNWHPPAHQILTAQANNQPEKIAVQDETRQLTYAELEHRSNQLAHFLQASNIGKNDVVAIYADRNANLPLAMLAIHKAGAAFLILDPAYPAARLHAYLQQANPKAWLQIAEDVPTRITDFLNEHGITCRLTLPTSKLDSYPTTPPQITTAPDDLATVTFTSGTTGKPRAIAGSHQPLAHFWAWQTAVYNLTPHDQFTLLSGLAHDPLLRDIFTPLVAGGTLHIPTADTLYSANTLTAWMAERGITVTHLTPALGKMMTTNRAPLPALRVAFWGGEALPATLIETFQQMAPAARSINFYGTTETPQAIGMFDASDGIPKTIAPLGRGIDGVQLLVLTADQQLAGVGELGQIAVRTPYLARGYVDDDALTATKFIRNPFLPNPPDHDRLYLTGDNGRFLPNGAVEFIGRSDGQVNVRGFRIELGEIEAALIHHSAVAQAVVQAPNNDQLVAYFVPQADAPDEDDLRTFLQATLPSYMMPSRFISLPQFPLTPNGKLDVRALPQPDFRGETAVRIPPSTPTETALVAIWADVLPTDQFGIADNFFALGGHSLLGTQIISRIRHQLGVELPLQTVFTAPTIAALAQQVETAVSHTELPLEPHPPQADYPLSFAQQRLWFLHRLEQDNAGYTIGTAVSIHGTLNIDALTQSINAIITRHESLRTQFIMVDDQPRQQIQPAIPITILVEDVPADADLTRLIDTHQRHPFDLHDSLVRFKLLRLAADHHILLLNMHHIIADGWSATVLTRELSAAYAQFAAAQPWEPAPLPIQYRDFAQWQREWLSGDVLDAQIGYWREQLAGDLPIIDLPADAPRPAQQTFAGAKQVAAISAPTNHALRRLSNTHHTTLFMTLLAGFKLLLHRLTAHTDIIVGSPIANRNRQEIESLIGFFANTLVLRTQFAPENSFTDLLHAVRETTLGAYAHQDVPFEQLVEQFQPERDLSRPPLFQLFFNMINMAEYGKFSLPDLETAMVENGRIQSKFDLTLYAIDDGADLRLEMVYNRDLYHPERMATLLDQYVALLDQIVQMPERPLTHFDLTAVSTTLPNPTQPLPTQWHTPAHQLLTRQAERYAGKTAVSDPNQSVTFAELEARSNQLAHHLLANGIQKGEFVAIGAQRRVELVVAMLATHKAGAAFAILDLAYPPLRLIGQLAQAKPAAWLQIGNEIAPELESYLAEQPLKLRANLADLPLANHPTTPPEITVLPHNLATISFTSGTTGQPQAICGTHLPLAHFWQWHTQTFDLSASDQFTMLSGLAHDPLLRDVFTPLVTGATLHIPDGDEMLMPKYLANWLAQNGITAVHLTPALSQLITTAGVPLPNLRTIFLGGERLTPQVVADWHAIAPQATCVNFYGTTETPQAMGFHVMAEDMPISLGHGIDGVQLLVLTPENQLAGVGELGQIGIRTPYLAQGYLGDDALTTAKFIPNPFVPNPHESDRIYLTGDNGRFLPNGDVQFIGRDDGQMNLRGYRIERSEIEAVLVSHPDVQRAVVHLHDKTLVAYVVGEPANLRHFLQQRLPATMRPSAIVPLAQLPLTPNGKVDYRALPDPAPYLTTDADSFVAPRTATEIEISTMWTDLLSLDRVGIHDDFFALGGHSLLATQLISRMQTLFETAVPLTTFFAQPTIAHLATFIDTAQRGTLAPPIQPIDTTAPQPLSFAQQRLWFLDQLDETAFNIPLAIRLRGQLNEPILAESINQIVQRHASLRTTFTLDGDEAMQTIRPFTPIPLHAIDLTHLAEAQAIATKESLHKFNLQADCLLRAHLLRLSATDAVLLITIHHIAADGWSLGVLLDELTAVYTARKQNQTAPLPPLPIQYQDYAVWQRNWLQGDVLESQLSYWRQQLANTPAGLALPTDYPRTTNANFAAALHRFTLPPALAQQLKTLGQQERSTLFMTLLTAFKILLYRYTGQTDIVVGSPIANRNQQEIEKLIGFFVNTLVLRTQLDSKLTVVELLAQVREIALAAYTHQDIPFEKLVEVLQPDRDMTRTPFFQVMFVLQNAPQNELTLPDLTLETFPLTERLAQYDLTTVMWEADGTLQGVIEYKTALFTPETIAQLCTHFTRLLTAMVDAPQQQIGRLPLLSADEMSELTAQQDQPVPMKAMAVHTLFEQTAVSHPHNIAIEAEGETITYAQLNQNANQLARYMQSEGIQQGKIVAILLPRSIDALTALLATLKAGAAYLMLDPAYPTERIETMLADAQPSLVVTKELLKAVRLADFADGNLERPYQPENPAYILYTSGSTGKPKGVLIPHRALSNHCQAIQIEFDLQPADRALQFASLSFDVAAEEIFPTWAAGATLVLRPAELPLSFTDYVAAQRLSVLNLPASYWHEWVASSADAGQNVPDCVRLMVVGSEKVSPARWAEWQTIAPAQTRWLNGYGPTETTITATLYEPSQNATIATTAMPIGKPIANVTTHVLDEHLQPVPTGVVGELYIGGAGLALGYLARPARTAQAFITHPQSGQRLYKTGDLVRRLADGNLAFIGRADNQAKVRGFRIELGEIEAALRLHPHVRDCLVVTRELADHPTQLVAYCVMDDLDVETNLRQFLQTQLPSYMIPATFVPLEQFSYTPNGKIDRRALPAPSRNGANSYVAPTNDTEQCVADIWADVLTRPQVGIHDNFFDLGGHSLIATQIVSRIRQALGVELPIRTLFESPTVAELVKNLPTTDLFDESEEALLADLMSEFDDLDFDELEDLI